MQKQIVAERRQKKICDNILKSIIAGELTVDIGYHLASYSASKTLLIQNLNTKRRGHK